MNRGKESLPSNLVSTYISGCQFYFVAVKVSQIWKRVWSFLQFQKEVVKIWIIPPICLK